MGEENRESSGSGTAMIVIAILGGILLLGCCGGVVVLGGSFFYARLAVNEAAKEAQMEAMDMQDQARQNFEKASADMEKLREEIKVPEPPPIPPPPEIAPVPTPPSGEDKKE
jgi:hypothetical protein